MKYAITINPAGKISIETSETSGPRCLKITELIRTATGGTLESLRHKQEFFEPEGDATFQQFNTPDLEQSA
jgi:hypothetical protein